MIETIGIFIFIIFISYIAYLFHSLSASGGFAAVLVGFAIYIGFQEKGLLLLGIFFVTSSFWSKYKAGRKRGMEEKLEKGSRRDWRQVIANGGAASFFSIAHFYSHEMVWLIGFIVCLGSANSDTWASEIGSLSKGNPIFIRTWRPVERGTSGAVSFLGSLAAILGALFISLVSFWLFHLSSYLLVLVFFFSYLGNVIDTLMGAFYQQLYVCSVCGMETERTAHCHKPAKRVKGLPLVDNDMVNFLSGVFAAILALLIAAV